jgi:hypothetical protein
MQENMDVHRILVTRTAIVEAHFASLTGQVQPDAMFSIQLISRIENWFFDSVQ